MAHQAVLNDGPRPAASNGRPNGLIENVSSFGNDLATLATLQSKLVAADARESLAKSAPALAGLALAILLAFAGSVAILGGLGLWLAEAFALKPAVALMLTGLGALVVVALLAAVCVKLLGSSFTTFRRSAEELERNLAWIKTTLTYSGR
ncbi:phage holin family protein [Paludisphaera mucosa]|uniref:Phage holin family protein n=1 Tax=Paludisphaera mucosa TaxID=3030827 RepID=A0ABT6FKK1_9BACT|nr:phage holin family protein [Paludisphaera mucosa]MDG3008097.1 phage holin family protein [Paludisphaera mucosa]